MIYSLPFTLGARRYVYFGGGPAFNFVEQSFENHEVSFSDFHYDSALNILLGVQFRSGLFTELKTISIWQLIRNKYKREPLKAIQFASVLDHVGPSQFITREDGCNRFSLLCITLYT